MSKKKDPKLAVIADICARVGYNHDNSVYWMLGNLTLKTLKVIQKDPLITDFNEEIWR